MTDALSDGLQTDRVAERTKGQGARTVNSDDFPGPLRDFLARLDELRSENTIEWTAWGGSWWTWPPTRTISVR